ncbi:hypothetical protein Cgig2_005252 [Carnegiea gigantea]|uniref:Uncharacterized protein n=1 Tax=Carnegiea gigantea TaxID=171969 RepID=A0A9Q1K3Y7_9CARY|nr:hypothetical protein Cgig2_005252 [Carnegiea gigantea]
MPAYAVEAFLIFEKEFIDEAAYNYKAVESSSCALSFEVWGIRVVRDSHGVDPYEFCHIVTYNRDEGVVECTYGQGKDSNSLPNVLNPPGSHHKGVRNKRFKSTVEKKCDQFKRRKSTKLLKTDVGSSLAPPHISLLTLNLSSSASHVQHHVGSFPSSYFHPSYYSHPSNIGTGFIPIAASAVLQQFHTDKFLADATPNDEH